MNKKHDNAYLNQYTDNAIKRGYEIYDEWIDRKHSSRKIVASAHGALKLFKKSKTMPAFIEVLAYIFAIDTRIKERYNNLLRCLLSYFSWRRETRALTALKTELNFPPSEMDIRDLIAVEIEKLAEKLADGWDEDGDDEAHGGKRNGKAEEEAAAEEKEAEETAEENPEAEELTDNEEEKETSEEKENEPIKEELLEKAQEEIGEEKEAAEPQQAEAEIEAADEKEAPLQEKNDNLKEANNVSDDVSEPSIDKKEEAKAYNDAVDSTPLYEDAIRDRSPKQTSLIDEIIMDNMVKGVEDILGNQRTNEVERKSGADIRQDTVASQNEKNKSTDKGDYLNDKRIVTDKVEAQQSRKAESAKQAEKVSETKVEQPKETVQNKDNVNSIKQEHKPLSETFRSNDLNANLDNDIADALNANMSLESKMAIIRMKEDQLREHMSITLEELGMDDTSDVLRVSEPVQVSPPRAIQNSK